MNRAQEAENKYKIYKNKLISIMRLGKKDYYHKQLEQHKNDIQGRWKVLNNVIKNVQGTQIISIILLRITNQSQPDQKRMQMNSINTF